MIWRIFDTWIYRSVTGLYSRIHGSFKMPNTCSLWDENTYIIPCFLDFQKVFKFAQVFSLKMREQVLFKSLNAIVITTGSHYVIQIGKTIDILTWRIVLA